MKNLVCELRLIMCIYVPTMPAAVDFKSRPPWYKDSTGNKQVVEEKRSDQIDKENNFKFFIFAQDKVSGAS